MMRNPASETSPPWGSIPLDIFLLETWDSNVTQNLDQRRTQLVRQYVELGGRGRERYHELVRRRRLPEPSQDQVALVLQPLRTAHQRRLATNLGLPGTVWLRTSYEEGTDMQHEDLMANIDIEIAVDKEENLLNDSSLYNYGGQWSRIFDCMPELIASPPARGDDNWIRQLKRDNSRGTRSEGEQAAIDQAIEEFPMQQSKEIIFNIVHAQVHKAYTVNYLIVEDREALLDRKVLLLFLDDRGHIVRYGREEALEGELFGGAWMDGAWDEMGVWQRAQVGPDYQEGGVRGPPYDLE